MVSIFYYKKDLIYVLFVGLATNVVSKDEGFRQKTPGSLCDLGQIQQNRNPNFAVPLITLNLFIASVLNISTTTTQASADSLSWIETINLDSLKNVGITKSVLIRCRELYPAIPPEGLEELVSRFSVYVKEPKNRVQNARGFFISLAKQLSEGIVPLDHIEMTGWLGQCGFLLAT